MDAAGSYVIEHWLGLGLLGFVVALVARRLVVRRLRLSGVFGITLLLVACAAIGGLGFLEAGIAYWLMVIGASLLFGQLALLAVTATWLGTLAVLSGMTLALGLGGLSVAAIQDGVEAGARFLWGVRLLTPIWLVCLLGLPIVFQVSRRSLAGLGSVRRSCAIGLRCLVLALVALALAEAQGRRLDTGLTVLFVWDRSLSMPRDGADGDDAREKRMFDFIRATVAKRPPGRQEDKVGVLVFGREAHVDLSPGRVPELHYRKVLSPVDGTFTDIAAALRLARASFPQDSARRIVLISDGKENLGKALKEAENAKSDGVQIDVVPMEGEASPSPEVVVEFVEAPNVVEHNARVPVRVRLRNLSTETVSGTLVLYKKSFAVDPALPKDPLPAGGKDESWPRRIAVTLPPGVKEIYEQAPGLKKNEAYLFEAVFLPVIDGPDGKSKLNPRLAGDRPQNNRASAGVVARGDRSVLLIEQEAGEHKLLARRLQHKDSGLKVVSVVATSLPKDSETFAFILNKFDGLILANLPAELINEEQQRVIRSAVHDQGLGLIMIGGPQAFGAGGWQGSEVEKALPVTADLKSLKIETQSGLVLIMHASEIAEGNAWQRKIAKLAVDRLSPVDMIGMIYWDHFKAGGHKWHIPFQEIGKNKGHILGLIDRLDPGDMPEVDSAFMMAHAALTKPKLNLGTKHIILISDGDHWNAGFNAISTLRKSGITCTTVCITSHGQGERERMKTVADLTGGRFHDVRDPRELPAIYIKESRLVSKAFVHEETFRPLFRKGEEKGPVESFSDKDLVDFHGFVRTTRRPSPLVNVPIETPKIGEYHFPLLAFWQYGLGKAVAFTSDARSIPAGPEDPAGKLFWDKDWAGSGEYTRYWDQLVKWSLRTEESGKFLEMETPRVEDGKVKLVIRAHDKDKTALTNVKFEIGLTNPTFKDKEGKKTDVRFEQVRPGVYEAEMAAEEIGTYFITARASWKDAKGGMKSDSVRGAVTIPYSPEFGQVRSETSLLDRIRAITGGNRYEDNAKALMDVAASGVLFRPVPIAHQSLQPLWPWLVLLAAIALVLEVAVRRIAVDPRIVLDKTALLWHRLRGETVQTETLAFLERLKARKADIGDDIEKRQGSRRFEGGPVSGDAPPEVGETARPKDPPKPSSAPQVAPEKEHEPDDFAGRLMKAKRKAMEERDKKKD